MKIKPGKDFYFVIFLIEVIVVIFILFGYSTMTTQGAGTLADSVSSSRFSGIMVLFLFLQVCSCLFRGLWSKVSSRRDFLVTFIITTWFPPVALLGGRNVLGHALASKRQESHSFQTPHPLCLRLLVKFPEVPCTRLVMCSPCAKWSLQKIFLQD